MSDEPVLRTPTFAETVAIDNYKAAMSNALSAADSLADKIVTASFSVATAYGAVLALVAAKDDPHPLLILAPFVLIGGAVGLALYAQSLAIPLQSSDKLDVIRQHIDETTSAKRLWARVALLALAIGIIVAGYVIRETYGPSAEDDTAETALVWLTPAGSALVDQACGTADASELTGEVDDAADFADDRVAITVDSTACPNGEGTLLLPQRAIAVAKATP